MIAFFRSTSLLKALALAVLLFAVSYAVLQSQPLAFTGDEPIYVYCAVSFGEQHDFTLAPDNWFAYCDRSHIRRHIIESTGKPSHSVALSVLLSPIARFCTLYQLRLTALLTGLLGLVGLYGLLKHVTQRLIVIYVVLFFVFFSLPVAAYLHCLYPEIWLFAIVVWSLNLMQRRNKAKWLYVITPLLTLVGPFFHIRLAFVAAGLFTCYLLEVRKDKIPVWLKLILPVSLAAGMAALFAIYQLHFHGSLSGSGSAPSSPSLTIFIDRLLIQLFESRHGLMAYSPIWILGIAGLIQGVVAKHTLSIQAFVLLFLYMASFVWGIASESFTARFWVAGIPFFAVGLARWFAETKPVFLWVMAAPLAAITLLNEGLFLANPSLFLLNRINSVTYDYLFDRLGRFHLGAFLPWETLELSHEDDSLRIARNLGLMTGVIVICQVAIFVTRRKWATIAGTLVTLLTMAITLSATNVTAIGKRDYSENRFIDQQTLELIFNHPRRLALMRFSQPRDFWPAAEYPGDFALEVTTERDRSYHDLRRVRASPFVVIPYPDLIRSIRIHASHGSGEWLSRDFDVFARDAPAFDAQLTSAIGAFGKNRSGSGPSLTPH